MKISNKVQRRTIIFASLAAIFALFQVALLAVQIYHSNSPYSSNVVHAYIGEIDTQYGTLSRNEDYDKDAIVIERDSEGKPLVEALPASLILFSNNPDYTLPDHFGWKANRLITYTVMALFVVIVLLVGWILLGAIQGFRTGNIFRHNHPHLLRWLALATFIYYVLANNRTVFTQLAIGEIYGEKSPIDIYSAATVGIEVFITPLLLLIFAELMAVAARINEDEAMTI